VKIKEMEANTVLKIRRSRHLGKPDYATSYSASKTGFEAKIGFRASQIESFGCAKGSEINIDEKQGQ